MQLVPIWPATLALATLALANPNKYHQLQYTVHLCKQTTPVQQPLSMLGLIQNFYSGEEGGGGGGLCMQIKKKFKNR